MLIQTRRWGLSPFTDLLVFPVSSESSWRWCVYGGHHCLQQPQAPILHPRKPKPWFTIKECGGMYTDRHTEPIYLAVADWGVGSLVHHWRRLGSAFIRAEKCEGMFPHQTCQLAGSPPGHVMGCCGKLQLHLFIWDMLLCRILKLSKLMFLMNIKVGAWGQIFSRFGCYESAFWNSSWP